MTENQNDKRQRLMEIQRVQTELMEELVDKPRKNND